MYLAISRLIHGDFIWFIFGGLSAILFSAPAIKIRKRWLAIPVYIMLAFVGVLLSHYLFEQFMSWYTTPLGPSLTIIK